MSTSSLQKLLERLQAIAEPVGKEGSAWFCATSVDQLQYIAHTIASSIGPGSNGKLSDDNQMQIWEIVCDLWVRACSRSNFDESACMDSRYWYQHSNKFSYACQYIPR